MLWRAISRGTTFLEVALQWAQPNLWGENGVNGINGTFGTFRVIGVHSRPAGRKGGRWRRVLTSTRDQSGSMPVACFLICSIRNLFFLPSFVFSSTTELPVMVWSGFEALASAIFDFGLLQIAGRGPRSIWQNVLCSRLGLNQCFSTKADAGNQFPVPELL